MRFAALCLSFALAAPVSCFAQASDKYRITPAEKAACTYDATRLCAQTYPDEDALFACMKQYHESLSATCRTAFDAGLKRRKL